jgi:hypothetical protein
VSATADLVPSRAEQLQDHTSYHQDDPQRDEQVEREYETHYQQNQTKQNHYHTPPVTQ